MFNKINIVLPLIILLSLLFTDSSQCQSYLITKYSTDNGLPDNRVNDIAQDSLGRIWIAMTSGIAMYDGYEWTKFGEKEGVPEIEYIAIKTDEKGIIWFLPKDVFKKQLVFLKNEQWNFLDFSTEVIPKSMHCNSLDIRYRGNKPEIYISTITEGLIKYYNQKWFRFKLSQGLISDSISAVSNINNKIHIATYRGISILDQSDEIVNYDFKNQNINPNILGMVYLDKFSNNQNSLILFSNDWIGEFLGGELKKWNYKFYIPFMAMNDACAIRYHSSGIMFFGNASAVYSINLNSNKIEKIILENPNSDRGARSIFLDYESDIWLPSLRGLYKLTLIPFENISTAEEFQESEVSAVSEFNSGKLFFGHNYGFSTLYKNKISNFKISTPRDKKIIYRIMNAYHDSKNDIIYFASFQKGIGKLFEDGRLIWIKNENINSYHSLFIGANNKIIVSTDQGYGYINDDKIILYKIYTESYVRMSAYLNDSTIYLATPTGLELYNFKSQKTFKRYNSTNNNLFSVSITKKYNLLAGSSDGLFILKNDSLTRFNFNNQEINEPIYFIIQDSLKNIWLGTNNGVLKWDGKDLTRYNKSDGLAGNETNRAAGFVDRKGNVWIGTDEGVSMYTGNEPDYSKYPPKIMLLNIMDHSSSSYFIDQNISLKPDKNNLIFNYRGLSFIDEKRNLFQIRLEEIDGDYQNEFFTKSNSAIFNNLAAGDYIFSARVKNSKGIWSNWQKSSIITIQKYFYQEFLFQFSLFVVTLFLMYSAYNYLQQKKYTRKLELAVDVRTKNLRDTQVELITTIDRYKGIVESQSDLVVRIDASGNFTFVNDSYCVASGKNRDELIGNSFTPLIHPDDVETTLEEMKKLNIPPFRIVIQHRALTIDGYRWFSWENYAIHDHKGKILEVQAVGRDITIQKEVESELEKRVAERTVELQSLISQSPLGIITFSYDGCLLNFNKAANEIFLNLNEYLPPDKRFNIFEDEFLIKNDYKNSLFNLDKQNSFLLSAPIKIDNNQNQIYSNLYNRILVYRIYSVVFDETNKMYVLLLDDVTENQKSEEISKKLLEEKIRISTIIKTIETERDRITKELHDGIGQQLTAVKLKLDIIKMKSEQSKAEVDDALRMLINAGDEIRRIINDLKPSDVENLGLISSMELLCERIRQASNINIQFKVSNIYRLPAKETELIVYRVVQEALNNIVKHSRCTNAEVEIFGSQNSISLKIWDDGIGSDKNECFNGKNTFGLNNIIERIKSVNGEVEIETGPEEGFKYLIKIPF
jgi:PAS domain S-box-containing protein